MRRLVVIDKNFLQGTHREKVLAMQSAFQLVMPGALFFELLTTDAASRRKCFSKLPTVSNPVLLVDHIGVLLRHELSERRPCGPPSAHRLAQSFTFNERLLDENYELPDEARATLASQIAEVDDEVARLVDLSEQTPDLFPGLLNGSASDQSAAVAHAEGLIANVEAVREFYARLESPDPALPYPPIESNPGSWAHIRWLQVKMLFATDLYVRYRGQLRQILTPKVLTRIEHDVHDAQILALAVLEGALFTREQKLLRWFKLLRPDRWASTGDA